MRYNKPVILTMMCQHNISHGTWIDSSLMMRWLQVTRPTALDVLNEYHKAGYLEKRTTKYRSNAVKYFYRPVRSIFAAYRRGDYTEQYHQAMAGF